MEPFFRGTSSFTTKGSSVEVEMRPSGSKGGEMRAGIRVGSFESLGVGDGEFYTVAYLFLSLAYFIW